MAVARQQRKFGSAIKRNVAAIKKVNLFYERMWLTALKIALSLKRYKMISNFEFRTKTL